MRQGYSIFPLGDQAVSFEYDTNEIDPSVHQVIMSMQSWIKENPFDGLLDIVIGYRSISVVFDLRHLPKRDTGAFELIRAYLERSHEFAEKNKAHASTRQVTIPVCYDHSFGLDLDFICSRNNITVNELVRIHTSQRYTTFLVGFLPGFPYLGFVNEKIEVPRRDSPRTVVPAGSVGIAGKQTGIYPLDSPGGWQIIGRTPLRLFDPLKDPPVMVEPGDTVTFQSISKEEFNRFQQAGDEYRNS